MSEQSRSKVVSGTGEVEGRSPGTSARMWY